MLPPMIPTSFTPHSAPSRTRGSGVSSGGVFSFFSYLILGVVFVLAIGVFSYARILDASESSKSAALAKEESMIDPETVNGFVRLRDRLISGEKLLAEHIAFSSFFSLLGELVPETVRFTSLNLSIDNTGKVKIEGSGVAKTFNALAVLSLAFAQDGHIKDAIFSNIEISNRDGSVSFALVATLDPRIVFFSPEELVAVQDTIEMTSTSTNSVQMTATTTP